MRELRELGRVTKTDGYDPSWDWDVQIRQVYEYCQKADEELEKIQTRKRKVSYNLSLARWNDFLRKAITQGDLANARLIQKEIDKLTGVLEFGADGGEAAKEEAQIRLSDGTVINL